MPIYGLQAAGLVEPVPFLPSIQAIAEDYAGILRDVRPHGPYYLLGWSFGGIVAHELACLLRKDREEVALLAVLDTYPIVETENLPELNEQEAIDDFARVVGLDPTHLVGKPFEIPGILAAARKSGHILGALEVEQAERMLAIGTHHAMLIPGFVPDRFDGDMVLFVATEQRSQFTRPELWTPHVNGRIQIHEIPCRHAQMMDPVPLAAIARILKSHLSEISPQSALTRSAFE
jgi:thioesterase domain-containing protein